MTVPAPPAGNSAGNELPYGSITVIGDRAAITGDIDYDLAEAWLAENNLLLAVSIVDTRDVTYLGSAGMRLLLRLAQAAPQPVLLLTVGRVVRRVLEVTGMTSQFDVVPDSASTPRRP